MALKDYWLGGGILVGGSIGLGLTTAWGVVLNAADLVAGAKGTGRTLRYAEVKQCTLSGTLGFDFSGKYDSAFMVARVNSSIFEILGSDDKTEGKFELELDGYSTAVGRAIGRLGKIDRSVARAAGVSYAWTSKLAKLAGDFSERLDLLDTLVGPPPALFVVSGPGLPCSFGVTAGWSREMVVTTIQSTGLRRFPGVS